MSDSPLTPKDEVSRNTYSLFDLENGVPTDAYPLDDAVRDGFLVPPRAVSVPLRFQREGIAYDELSDDDKDEWDALEWGDDGNVPDRVEAAAINRWLFNKDTVDKVLAHVMTRGLTVAGGDRLGKTIVFAKNQHHAQFIAERFDVNYPQLKGEFARVITFKTEYAQSLIDSFSVKDKAPHIAISVDMLDTGIDIPEVANLVFFKLVRSKTKFWQMLGRGTRLCPELFGPGQDKTTFFVFDYCQNLEYFSQDIATTDGSAVASLGKRLFDARLQLIAAVDDAVAGRAADPPHDYEPGVVDIRASVAGRLRDEVAAMNLDNFVVRPHRRLVERYAEAAAWDELTPDAHAELSAELAGLPNELDPETEEAKRFDLLTLRIQVALLRGGSGRQHRYRHGAIPRQGASVPSTAPRSRRRGKTANERAVHTTRPHRTRTPAERGRRRKRRRHQTSGGGRRRIRVVRPLHRGSGCGDCEAGDGGVLERSRPEREPTRVHQPHSRAPDDTRLCEDRKTLRVALHGPDAARPDQLFGTEGMDQLLGILDAVRTNAVVG